MVQADKLLDRMRTNPRDWRIEDVVSVCLSAGIACSPPRKGSHYKVKHHGMAEILTIPAHRPIKPIYIRELVRFVDAVRGSST
ncbi:type II toxin-antitoxin system HicA family toxin [Sphingomonas sp. PB2P19]|uniref:type II toxin-antitoxin system HicA family toxin n=1 Tax=Sphingomonas rhamnosi TaxID=3096156 RepID=UPI002FC7F5A3